MHTHTMSSYEDFFKNKKVTILGLGLLGRGVGDAEFIAKCGAQVTVTDKKTQEELAESVARLTPYPNITYHLGGHKREDFTTADIIIKAAGVRLDSREIAAAHEVGVPVYMSTALFAKWAQEDGAVVVGITGTRGKSTVTQMIYTALQKAGKPTHLGGNVRGISSLAMIPDIKNGDIVVLELDSWQLQGFGDLKMSPQVAIFTNLMADHQNYYPDMELYFRDKANIFLYQKEGDTLVCGAGIVEQIKAAGPKAPPHVPSSLPEDWQLQVIGQHNRENAALAAEALKALGLTETEIRNGLESFEAVEGRLQFVRQIRGIQIYNDNNATTPEATMAALSSLPSGKIILIMGGADKGLDMSDLLYQISHSCKRVILLSGTGTDKVVPFMSDYSVFDSLEDAVHEAVTSASVGDIVLFSPSFASFGMFTNEYDRNDKFMKVVESL